MKKTKAFLIVFSIGLLITGVAMAGLYKWVDENGVTHFSDSPPTHGNSSGKVESVSKYRDGAPTVRYADHESLGNNSNTGKKEKYKTPNVELYVTSWCPYCKMASNFLSSKGIPFKKYDIEKDKAAASRKRQLDRQKGVPFAVINGMKIHGFSKTAYENALRQSP